MMATTMNNSTTVFAQSEELWNELLEDRIQKLKLEDQARLREMLNYDTFQKSLTVLLGKYKGKRELTLLRFLKPIVEGLETFSKAITSISQANPFSSLGWGVAQLLLESADHSYKVLSHISSHLEDLTKTLPRCSDYVDIFPNHPRLRTALRDVCKLYVAACIDTAVYLGKRPLFNMVLVYVYGGRVKRDFDDAKLKIEMCKLDFEREVNFAHVQSNIHFQKVMTKAIVSVQVVEDAPRVTTLPFGRNASFVCRDNLLERIRTGLYPTEPGLACATRSCVIHGMGGVGKTQTSLEFAYRFTKPRCAIFWLRAETPAELAETFGRIARVLNLAKDSEMQDQTQLATLAQQWLSKHPDWLLIFDNVMDFQSIQAYWPACPHGAVIVTTQNRDLKHSATFSIHLKPMPEDEGARVLLNYLDHGDEDGERYQNDVEHAKIISRELEGLPIAIAHVAGYIDQSGRPLSYCLEQLRERQKAFAVWSMDSRTSTTHQYERTLAAVWDLAFSTLGKDARALMDILAMLNPESIPEDMLLGETDGDPIKFDRIRIELLSRHLVRVQGETSGSALAIHRSLQKNLLFCLDSDLELRQSVFKTATKLVRECFPRQSPIGVPVNHRWSVFERYLPHVLALHAVYVASRPEIKGDLDFAELLCDAGYYMWDRNLGIEGIPILETAEKICLLDKGKHGRRLRANIGVALGSLLNTLGIHELHRARQLFDDILLLRQAHNAELPLPHSQEEQLLLSNAWNDKGWMCLECEDYLAAEDCFERSLKIKRQWSEKDIPFEFAETMKNLALVRLAQKRSKDALKLAQHALQLLENDTGTGPATVLKFRLYAAEVLTNSGQIEVAMELAAKVAVGRQEIYRPYHPFNLDIYYFRGILFHYHGSLIQAEEMLRQALKVDVCDPPPDEFRARSLYALSEVLEALGNKKEAETYRIQAFGLLDQWRHLFLIKVAKDTHDSVLFDHIVPLKCTRLSKYGKLWVGEVK